VKVLRLHGPNDLRLHEEPEPTAGEGELLVRVTAVGLCGSDRHWLVEGGIGDAVLERPLVLGHEFVGTVASGPRTGERVALDPSKLLGDDWELDESDRDVLSRPDFAVVIREATEDTVRGGPWGWVDDDLAFTRPWGFDLAEIHVPVEVRYGSRDVLVPAAHGEWLGRNVPGARVVVEDAEGHMGDPDKVLDLIRWLVTGE